MIAWAHGDVYPSIFNRAHIQGQYFKGKWENFLADGNQSNLRQTQSNGG